MSFDRFRCVLDRIFSTTTKNDLPRRFENGSKAVRKKPPRLMARINRGGHILLTEAVMENQLTKSINRDGQT